jgi:tRNA pseudouridine55 synthase
MGRRGSRRPPAFTGFALVDKPGGCTSHDVVQRIRRIFGQRQVGHTGTLDPMATGLLVVALGHATRLAQFVEARDKAYAATVELGVGTDTYDADGTVTARAPFRGDTAAVDRALAELEGEIEQKVPAYSAVKVDGQRLYARARRDEAVQLPTRRVTVHRLRRVVLEGSRLEIETRVSKGTYVRSLAVQIGAALEVPAHLAALRRTSVGALDVAGARPLEAFEGRAEELVTPAEVLQDLPAVTLDARGVRAVGFGQPLPPAALTTRRGPAWRPGAPVVLEDASGRVLAVAEPAEGGGDAGEGSRVSPLRYRCVLPAASS